MTAYLKKSFSVAGWKAPKKCDHGWLDKKGKCVKCGEDVKPETAAEMNARWDAIREQLTKGWSRT